MESKWQFLQSGGFSPRSARLLLICERMGACFTGQLKPSGGFDRGSGECPVIAWERAGWLVYQMIIVYHRCLNSKQNGPHCSTALDHIGSIPDFGNQALPGGGVVTPHCGVGGRVRGWTERKRKWSTIKMGSIWTCPRLSGIWAQTRKLGFHPSCINFLQIPARA